MEMMIPLFTIIIPVYKVEAYLRKCLDSVLAQTCSDWECICVDDGSPDSCGRILDECAKCDVRIKVIHQENAGVSAARNAALDVAAGEWVQFVDADDYLSNDHLENLKRAIAEHTDVDVVEHAPRYMLKDGSEAIGTSRGRRSPSGIYTGDEILRDPWGRRFTDLTRVVWNKIFKRSLVEKWELRFAEGVPIAEDVIFSNCYYGCVKKALLCPELVGYNRTFRESSAVNTISAAKLLPQIEASSRLQEVWEKWPRHSMSVRVAGYYVLLMHLGRGFGEQTHGVCVDALVSSKFFNKTAVPFVLRHGTLKARMFAMLYLLACASVMRKKLLKSL